MKRYKITGLFVKLVEHPDGTVVDISEVEQLQVEKSCWIDRWEKCADERLSYMLRVKKLESALVEKNGAALAERDKRIAELDALVQKMKRCDNCGTIEREQKNPMYPHTRSACESCQRYSNWEAGR